MYAMCVNLVCTRDSHSQKTAENTLCMNSFWNRFQCKRSCSQRLSLFVGARITRHRRRCTQTIRIQTHTAHFLFALLTLDVSFSFTHKIGNRSTGTASNNTTEWLGVCRYISKIGFFFFELMCWILVWPSQGKLINTWLNWFGSVWLVAALLCGALRDSI